MPIRNRIRLFNRVLRCRISLIICLAGLTGSVFFTQSLSCAGTQNQGKENLCLNMISSDGALLLANPDGEIILKKNETKKLIPASTLKLLTALAAIRYLGHDYRFNTEFYLDKMHNLKIKGYGDPVLISESIQSISIELAERARDFNNLILDDTFFSQDISIPGRGSSTNPYDAPAGALCANFNTVFFNRSKNGHIVSAEPVTPMTPYARQKIEKQGLKGGRCSIFSNQREGAIYAGELFLQFLGEQGVKFNGKILHGTVNPNDRLIYTYRSEFTLRDILVKMMEFSNNFIANQVLISLGAHVYSPPGTLDKGIKPVSYTHLTLPTKRIV